METGQPSRPADTQTPSLWYAQAMEQLVEVVQRLSLARDLQAVMDIVRRAARQLTGADGASFVLRDGDKCFYAEEDAISPLWKGQRFPINTCISGWAMLNRRPAVIEDIYADSRIPADAYRPTFVHSLAMVPIRTLDPIGAIGNYWAAHYRPSSEQIKVLQALADTTAVALENVRIYEELDQRVRLRTSELQAILDHVPVGIAFTVSGQVVRANPKLAEILGYVTPETIVGTALSKALQPATPGAGPAPTDAAMAHLKEARVFATETELRLSAGVTLWAHIAARALDSEDYPDSAIWVIEDISDAKAKETALTELKRAAEETTRFKSEFLASMSHELRTPLNAIIGFSEVLRDGLVGDLQEKQHEYVSDIFDSGQHLLSLINDVLDLSKIEAGKMVLDEELADVSLLLQNSVSIIREKAMVHGLRLEHDVPDALGEAWIDQRKCKQVVYNLLANAVKFTPEGGTVTLRARVVTREAAAQRAADQAQIHPAFSSVTAQELLEISVADTGIGISDEDMARLFQPFVQIDSSLSRQFEGTGLGLALVSKLVALHGGTVGLRSKSGVGSAFTVWLPYLSHAPLAAEDTDLPATVVSPMNEDRPLVLIIEDDDKAADLIRLQLEADHCRTVRATSGETALAILAAERPDLITLDILLPGMDGWEFLNRLKDSADIPHVPVVIVSIVGDSGQGLSLGAAEVLQKPVLAKDIHEALANLGLVFEGAVGKPVRVLVVDDDPQAVEILAAHLAQNHYQVLRAYDGREALTLARASPPDLIVLDLLMPETSGFEVMEELKSTPKTAHIPVIVLTAKPLGADEREQLNCRVLKVMEKSTFNHGRFMGEVRRALRKT